MPTRISLSIALCLMFVAIGCMDVPEPTLSNDDVDGSTGSPDAPDARTGSPDATTAPAMLKLEPQAHDFAAVDLAAPAGTHMFVATNEGNQATGPLDVTLDRPARTTYTIVNDECTGRSLATLESCKFDVIFDPDDVGSQSAAVIVSGQPGGSQTSSLVGTGTANVFVTLTGDGSGSVISTPAGIDCGPDCTAPFSTSDVTLTPSSVVGSRFLAWNGCTMIAGSDCSLTMSQERVVSATFERAQPALSAGSSHTCALTTAGGVKCWGHNGFGQLGDGTTTDRPQPVDVVGLTTGVVEVSAGSFHTCALTSGGVVKCWGRNPYGQLGNGTDIDSSQAVDVFGGAVAVAAGYNHSCAITSGGGLRCWGRNASGSVGDGTTTDRSTPRNVIGLSSGVLAVSLGNAQSCALTSSGGLKCWGYNVYGQVGDGTTTNRTAPVDVVGLTSGVVAVSAGGVHTCARTNGGALKCWGHNVYGAVGDGSTSNRSTPADVVGFSTGAAVVAAGGNHSCAITTTGAAKCWGRNQLGAVGDGTTVDRTTPAGVVGLSTDTTGVRGGGNHSCALMKGGELRCWGWNEHGQVGDGTTSDWLTPTSVQGL